jgi:deoxyribonuclease V
VLAAAAGKDHPVTTAARHGSTGPARAGSGAARAGSGAAGAGPGAAGAAGTVLAAADVCYPRSGGARAAAVLARDAAFRRVAGERVVLLPEAAPYQPGEFYLRELPPLLAVLAGLTGLRLLVVDGYVDLDPGGRPGLGAHAHAALGVPVIGVAKSAFATASHAVPVLRGRSARPLYVTAAGLPLADAARLVGGMSGAFRLPDALRRADALARGAPAAAPRP